jgi:putative hydrolase of the HAD superfamily
MSGLSGARAQPCGQTAPEAADLQHVDTWLFDLDNTLYPESAGILRLVEAKILDYFVELTGLDAAEAWALQMRYFEAHGSAAPGLLANHDVDPQEFLRRAHDVPLDALAPDPELQAALQRLPGRRLVFTNGSRRHAERVLERLELSALFSGVFHAEAAELVAKPDPQAFQRLIAAHQVTPATTAFFEDRAVNLQPAAALGMTTVLVGSDPGAPHPDFVRYRTSHLARFLAAARTKDPLS